MYHLKIFVKNKVLLFFFMLSFLTSCVPYKDIVYIQGDLTQQAYEKETYKIQKNDILYIQINSANDEINKIFGGQQKGGNSSQVSAQNLFFSGYTVDKEGNIELPVVKKIHVENKSFEEVKTLIKNKLLSQQLKSLDGVYIKVKLAGVPYTVIGEVGNPKTGILYKETPNLFDVLSDARDITQVGNRKEIIVLRYEDGKQIKESVDLTKADVINSPYFYVRPNDIIYVKPLRQKTWGTGTTLQQTISTTITALSLITTIIILSTN